MRRRRVALLPLVLAVALVGCASQSQRHHPVSVDSRPTPPPTAPLPPGETPGADTLAASPAPAPAPSAGERPSTPPAPAPEKPAADNTPPPPVPVGSVMTPEERRASLARIVADTTAAGAAVRKCGSRKLLPDQASVLETTSSLLEQARAALASDELWRAESLARKARQLAGSLECPG